MMSKKECEWVMTVHVVKTGENLWSISNSYGVPLHTILELNGLPSTSSIVPGLTLYLLNHLPTLRPYQIIAGNHIWQLAQQYHTDVSAILAANQGY